VGELADMHSVDEHACMHASIKQETMSTADCATHRRTGAKFLEKLRTAAGWAVRLLFGGGGGGDVMLSKAAEGGGGGGVWEEGGMQCCAAGEQAQPTIRFVQSHLCGSSRAATPVSNGVQAVCRGRGGGARHLASTTCIMNCGAIEAGPVHSTHGNT